MKRILLLGCCVLLLAGNAQAKKVYDIELPESLTVAGETLLLNGYGLRKKFFFKVYLGSLYAAARVSSTEQLLAQPGSKLIRMDFIHSKVDREKIVAAFAEGIKKNSPQLVGKPDTRQFLRLFNADFVAGDRVDLELTADGRVSARHNQQLLGSVQSPELAAGVLLIYLGRHPADDDLKDGMLGN